MKYTSALAVSASLVSSAAAHGGVLSYSFNGVHFNGFVPYNTNAGQNTIQRQWNTYNPVQDVTLKQVACNNDGTTLPASQQLTANVTAGATVNMYWNDPWPHNTGPMITYMALCPGGSCTGVDETTLSWFKIDQAGLLSGTVGSGQWAAAKMIANNNTWTVTIPKTIPNGNYLLRSETIALHSLPAQNYPECAQIAVTGGGSVSPPSSILVKFPGAYKQTDPGINIDIYGQAAQTQTTYVIPGPAVYPGNGATATSSSPPQTSSSPPQTSSSPPQTSSSPPQTTSSPSGTVAKYGQCGGQGYTGPTVCASGSTCTFSNQYYSQCL